MGGKDADRFPGLDQERFVISEGLERREDPVKGLPVACGFATPAVHDQPLRVPRDLGVEVILEKAERCLLGPSPTRERGSSWRSDYAVRLQRPGHRCWDGALP